MLVRELIKELSKYDDNLEVIIGIYSCPSPISYIEEGKVYIDERGSYIWRNLNRMDRKVLIINPEDTE